MEIQPFSVGTLQAQCYLLISENQSIIIDPGDEASLLAEELSRKSLSCLGLIATHGHFDHTMAAGELQRLYQPDVKGSQKTILPVYLHQEDNFLIKRMRQTAAHFLGYEPPVIEPLALTSLVPGEVEIGPFHFTVIHTPGHTPGSVSLYFSTEQVVFTGDTLFDRAIGRYDFSYSSQDDLKKSIESLLQLPSGTIVYPGHGSKTTIADQQFILNAFF